MNPKKGSKLKYVLFSTYVSESVARESWKKDVFPHVQDYKFIRNFVRSLLLTGDIDILNISMLNVSDYPHYPYKYIKGEHAFEVVENKKVEIKSISFINTTYMKLLTRFFGFLVNGTWKLLKNPDIDGIIVYGCYLPMLLPAMILARIFRRPLIGIWTDPPAQTNARDGKLKKLLRTLERRLTVRLMKKVDKVVAITEHLARDFAPKSPFIVINGFLATNEVSDSTHKLLEINDTATKKIVYAGSLERRYGIDNIVYGFIKADVKNFELEIYGRGDFESELKQICSEYKNVKYHGYIPPEEVLSKIQTAHFLINARDPKEEFVRYSFPSKMIEYLASGRPIISTFLPGMPSEIKEYIIMLEDNQVDTIARKIKEISREPYEKYYLLGQKAKEYALKNYSLLVQGKKIYSFLKGNDTKCST